MHQYLVLAALAGFASASPASGAETLAPTSPWNLRYDEDKCRIVRQFGAGENSVALMIDQSGVEPYYTVTIIGRLVRQANGKVIRIQFGAEPATERSFLKGRLEDGTPLLAMYGVTLAPVEPLANWNEASDPLEAQAIGPAREKAIDRIAFSGGPDTPFVLETGSMGDVLIAMRTCTADLANALGMGEGPNLAVAKAPQPKGNPGSWLTSADYPSAMLRRDEEGKVMFRLTVNSQGKPSACHITRSTRPQAFDDIVCLALLKRADFTPALGPGGKPVASYWRSSVRFEIPQ